MPRKSRKRSRKPLWMISAVLVVGAGVWAAQAFWPTKPQVLGEINTPDTRNQQRKANLETLRLALAEYKAAHRQTIPVVLPLAQTDICAGVSAVCKNLKLVDLNFLPNNGYVPSIPNDPNGGAGRNTSGYAAYRDKAGTIYLVAPRAENGAEISVKL